MLKMTNQYENLIAQLAAERAAIIEANRYPAPKTEFPVLSDANREALGLNDRYLDGAGVRAAVVSIISDNDTLHIRNGEMCRWHLGEMRGITTLQGLCDLVLPHVEEANLLDVVAVAKLLFGYLLLAEALHEMLH